MNDSAKNPAKGNKGQGAGGSNFRRAYVRIMKLGKGHGRTLLAGTFFLLLGSACSLAAPKAIGMIIDSDSLAGINQVALLLGGIFLLQGIAVGARYYLFAIAGYSIVLDLRSSVFQHLLAQEIGFFDKVRTGELLSRLSSDTTVLQNAVSLNISIGLRNGATLLGGMVMLVYTSPKLSLMMLVVVPPMVMIGLFFARKIRGLARAMQDALARAGEKAEEVISGVRTVRSFSREKEEVDHYHEAVTQAFFAVRRLTINSSVFQGGISILGYGAVALVFWYGGKMVVTGSLTMGDLTSFIMYTLLVATSLAGLGNLWGQISAAVGASERIFQLMDRVPTVVSVKNLKPEQLAGQIRFDKVHFSYPTRDDVVALADIQFHVEPGEVVALVGPSGSGKSTIAALIPRFYDPQEGQITLDGIPLQDLDPHWLRLNIGSVSQEPTLFSTTIGNNIAYGTKGASSMEDLRAAAASANALEFIEQFPDGFETEVGERGVRLSGGQKQRIAIARTLLKDPAVLILDEATSALDAESEFLVKQALERLMKGRTTLIIAHRLSTVRNADRVLVLENGTIVERGRHDDLMQHTDGLYRRLVERQFQDPVSHEQV